MTFRAAVLLVGGLVLSTVPGGASVEADRVTDAVWAQVRSLPVAQRPKVGLVLSGGGARGWRTSVC
jgi:hypothetical protein